MTFNWARYTKLELREYSTTVFRHGGGSRPDVLLIEIDGHKAVLKDQGGGDKWFALLIGPLLNWRECKALRKLSEVECIPELLAVPDKRSFLMSYHESEQITRLSKTQPDWPEFFDNLAKAIQQMHSAGVAHNDLRNPTNTLITPNGDPILVDLVACFCRGSRWNIINHWLFDKFAKVDLSAITKLKQKIAPELITEQDIKPEEIAGKAGLAAKGLGQWIRKLSRRLFTSSK
ncbi:MAG: hypothetical protein MK188_12855 [Gammaproteobacteria bacterium]|nr:hypothetical protein [Gammaproteobacteria bacterium]